MIIKAAVQIFILYDLIPILQQIHLAAEDEKLWEILVPSTPIFWHGRMFVYKCYVCDIFT